MSFAALGALAVLGCAPDVTNSNPGILHPGLYRVVRIAFNDVPVTLPAVTTAFEQHVLTWHGDSVRVQPDSTFTLYLSYTPQDPAGELQQEVVSGRIEFVPNRPFILAVEDDRFASPRIGDGQFTAEGMRWLATRLGSYLFPIGVSIGFVRVDEE